MSEHHHDLESPELAQGLGAEPFDTVCDGVAVIEHFAAGPGRHAARCLITSKKGDAPVLIHRALPASG